MDQINALERSYERLSKIVAGMGPEQLTAATPCTRWDVRAVLNHALGAGWMFTLVNQGKSVGEDAGDVIGSDPAGAVADAAQANIEAWRQPGALEGDRTYPFGTFSAPAALMINVAEIAVHGWDVAHGTNQEAQVDEEVAEEVYQFYRPFPLEMYRQHGTFGPEVPVDAAASPVDRMLGLLGRHP